MNIFNQARAINWDDANARARIATNLGLQNAPFVFDPTRYGSNQGFNTGLIYSGTTTTPRSDALKPGTMMALPALGAAGQAGASGTTAVPNSGNTPTPPIQDKQGSAMPSNGGESSTAPSNGGEGTPGQSMFKPADAPSWSYQPDERANDFSKLTNGQQPSWDVWNGNAFGAPKNGQITFGASMPGIPGQTSTGIEVGTDPNKAQQPNQGGPGGQWRYMGNDPSRYGGYAAGGEQPVADNARGVWQYEQAPSARSIFGLEDMIKNIFGQMYQQPDQAVMPDNSGAGMLPNG